MDVSASSRIHTVQRQMPHSAIDPMRGAGSHPHGYEIPARKDTGTHCVLPLNRSIPLENAQKIYRPTSRAQARGKNGLSLNSDNFTRPGFFATYWVSHNFSNMSGQDEPEVASISEEHDTTNVQAHLPSMAISPGWEVVNYRHCISIVAIAYQHPSTSPRTPTALP